jgi:hypothetical protein
MALIFSDNCSSLTGWTTASGDITQTTYDTQSTFYFNSTSGPCELHRTIPGSFVGDYEVTLKMYHTDLDDYDIGIPTSGIEARFDRVLYPDESKQNFAIAFCRNGLYYINGSAVVMEIGTNLVELNKWQTWRFRVYPTNTLDVYLDEVSKATGLVWTGGTGGGDGHITFVCEDGDDHRNKTYLDSILITSGYFAPIITMIR